MRVVIFFSRHFSPTAWTAPQAAKILHAGVCTQARNQVHNTSDLPPRSRPSPPTAVLTPTFPAGITRPLPYADGLSSSGPGARVQPPVAALVLACDAAAAGTGPGASAVATSDLAPSGLEIDAISHYECHGWSLDYRFAARQRNRAASTNTASECHHEHRPLLPQHVGSGDAPGGPPMTLGKFVRCCSH